MEVCLLVSSPVQLLVQVIVEKLLVKVQVVALVKEMVGVSLLEQRLLVLLLAWVQEEVHSSGTLLLLRHLALVRERGLMAVGLHLQANAKPGLSPRVCSWHASALHSPAYHQRAKL